MPYELKRSMDGKYVFSLKNERHEVLLTSGPFPKKAEALAAIEAVRRHAGGEGGLELRRAATGSAFFVVKAEKDRVLGRSELFESEQAARSAIQATRKHCPSAELRDWS